MIRELRKKFILIAMLSTFIVLSAIMGTVNISGYLKMAARADDMTSVLGINDGKFPGNGKEEMEAAGNENPPDVAVEKGKIYLKQKPQEIFLRRHLMKPDILQ